jgi:hypothetical protein
VCSNEEFRALKASLASPASEVDHFSHFAADSSASSPTVKPVHLTHPSHLPLTHDGPPMITEVVKEGREIIALRHQDELGADKLQAIEPHILATLAKSVVEAESKARRKLLRERVVQARKLAFFFCSSG